MVQRIDESMAKSTPNPLENERIFGPQNDGFLGKGVVLLKIGHVYAIFGIHVSFLRDKRPC